MFCLGSPSSTLLRQSYCWLSDQFLGWSWDFLFLILQRWGRSGVNGPPRTKFIFFVPTVWWFGRENQRTRCFRQSISCWWSRCVHRSLLDAHRWTFWWSKCGHCCLQRLCTDSVLGHALGDRVIRTPPRLGSPDQSCQGPFDVNPQRNCVLAVGILLSSSKSFERYSFSRRSPRHWSSLNILRWTCTRWVRPHVRNVFGAPFVDVGSQCADRVIMAKRALWLVDGDGIAQLNVP